MNAHIYDPLGDGISCLELIDSMGDDQSIVKAARVSYQRDHIEADEERDEKLIRYMLSHAHGTPFEHTCVTVHVALPIFVARQWIRHRIGWSYNEVSRRYTADDIQFYYPQDWRPQDTKNKQGSIDLPIDASSHCTNVLREACEEAVKNFDHLIRQGVAKEMARMVLPVNLYTRWYATANVRSVMHWHTLRADPHAQWEVRVYADAMSKIMADLFPVTWKVYLELKEEGNVKG